jgi:hypothetical protein
MFKSFDYKQNAREVKEVLNDHLINNLAVAYGRRASRMALQPRLGILPQWRSRSCTSGSSGPDVDGSFVIKNSH